MNHADMKIHIIFDITDGPRGGGNQFLKALISGLTRRGCYTDNADDAQIYLYNSYQFIDDVCALKKKYPGKTFIHRIDGPIRLYNSLSDRRDHVTNDANRLIADATIFQSEWSRRENYCLGLCPSPFEATIPNAVDPDIFSREGKAEFSATGKIKLIAVSWSNNPKKGFDTYCWLDDNLDFERYAMTFIGNTPVSFKNIHTLAPLNSRQVAEELKNHDIFITAAQKDPCSNALIEALSCGLPVIALRDGGHPEIVNNAGLLFETPDELPALLERISRDYVTFQKSISVKSLNEIIDQYHCFMVNVRELTVAGQYSSKRFSLLSSIRMKITLYRWHCGKVT